MITFRTFNGKHIDINSNHQNHEELRLRIITDMLVNTFQWSADKKVLVTESTEWKCIVWNTGGITRFSCKKLISPIELFSFWMNTSSVKEDLHEFMKNHPELKIANENITWVDVI